ncbi:MAG: alpha/beta hydrolase [Gammaproteobacteria bacterium]
MIEIKRVPWHEEVLLRGLRHRLTWWGERAPNPVILLHGWMDSGVTWQFLVDCLPADWPCVALDWRGFGASEWPQEGYWFPDYLADLEALLDRLSPDAPARLIAHSMGGNICTLYGGVQPKRIEWLVNVEGIGLARTLAEKAPERYAEWLEQIRNPPRERRYLSASVLAEFLVARNPRMPYARAEFLAKAWTKKDPTSDQGHLIMGFDPRHRNLNPTLYRRDEMEACWRRFEAPMLLVLAEQSAIRTRVGEDGTEEYFRNFFRNLSVVTLQDVGHMMHIEDPEALARHIVEFVGAR